MCRIDAEYSRHCWRKICPQVSNDHIMIMFIQSYPLKNGLPYRHDCIFLIKRWLNYVIFQPSCLKHSYFRITFVRQMSGVTMCVWIWFIGSKTHSCFTALTLYPLTSCFKLVAEVKSTSSKKCNGQSVCMYCVHIHYVNKFHFRNKLQLLRIRRCFWITLYVQEK